MKHLKFLLVILAAACQVESTQPDPTAGTPEVDIAFSSKVSGYA